MLLNCGVGEDSWESLGLQGDPTSPSKRKSVLNIHWKDWCWSWSSNTLATWCEELPHLKRPWCWERLKAGGEGDDRGWDGWMASLTQWAWVWVNSGSWQGGLVCCSLQSGKESDTTEVIELHWTTRHEEGADRQSMRLERYHWCHLWSLCSPRRVLSPHDHTHVGDKAGAHERWGTRNNVLVQNQNSQSTSDKEKWKPVKPVQQPWEKKKRRWACPQWKNSVFH